jgi:hypothetical protein
MANNEFLTIQEFIQKYEVPDIRIRRRIRKFRLVEPQKLEGVLSERYERGVGNILLLNEDFWVKELEAIPKDTAYVEPLKRSEETPKHIDEPLKQSEQIDTNRLSDTAYASSVKSPEEEVKHSDVISSHPDQAELNRLSNTIITEGQVIVDKEFLEILKEDRAEKKDWIKKYELLLVDYKAKDNELVEREKFLQGLVDKVITDAKTTKQLLVSQINHLQKQLHAPKKEEGIEFENGNFAESEEKQDIDI